MKAIVWSIAARRDLTRIGEFNDDRDPVWADYVDERIAARSSSLADLPYQGRPGRVAGTRELAIPDIQYVLVYELTENLVRIVRVWSTLEQR